MECRSAWAEQAVGKVLNSHWRAYEQEALASLKWSQTTQFEHGRFRDCHVQRITKAISSQNVFQNRHEDVTDVCHFNVSGLTSVITGADCNTSTRTPPKLMLEHIGLADEKQQSKGCCRKRVIPTGSGAETLGSVKPHTHITYMLILDAHTKDTPVLANSTVSVYDRISSLTSSEVEEMLTATKACPQERDLE